MNASHKPRTHAWVLTFAITLVVAMGAMAPQPSHAALATEVTQMLNQVQLYLAQANAVREYSEEAMRWKRTLEQYRDQLISLKSMVSDIGLPTGVQMRKIQPEDKYVAERCAGATGFSLDSVKRLFEVSADGDIIKMQREICANIQIARNRKYNETIDMIDLSLPTIKNALQLQRLRAASVTTSGDNNRVGADAEVSGNHIATGMAEWETRMKMYDAYIDSQQELQKVVARIGLKGNQTKFIGAAVKTALLQAALEVGN